MSMRKHCKQHESTHWQVVVLEKNCKGFGEHPNEEMFLHFHIFDPQ